MFNEAAVYWQDKMGVQVVSKVIVGPSVGRSVPVIEVGEGERWGERGVVILIDPLACVHRKCEREAREMRDVGCSVCVRSYPAWLGALLTRGRLI